MTKFFLFLIISLFTFPTIMAQLEASNWYFGENAALDFGDGSSPPVPISGSAMVTEEGCASISDPSGNLLFYTDGTQVWNRNHVVMPFGTGLLGANSSSQSAIVVPFPTDSNKYYLFTVDDSGGSDGLNYSVIDMTLDGGLGDVEPSSKNIQLIDNTAEKLTAVKSAGTGMFWVATIASSSDDTEYPYTTEEGYNDTFYAFKVTPTGIDSSAVISSVDVTENDLGYLKFSPDGTKMVFATYSITPPPLYDFDVNTGLLGDKIYITGMNHAPYGIEFSNDSSKLYFTTTIHATDYWTLLQYDIDTDILTLIHHTNNSRAGIQLAIDGKIYCALQAGYLSNTNFLGVIHNPNAAGILCNYEHDAIDLSVVGGYSREGLPQFIQSYFVKHPFLFDNICLDIPTNFWFENTAGVSEIVWDFGDGSPTVTAFSPSHIYTAPGTYTVLATMTSTTGVIYTEEVSITITDDVDATISDVEPLCESGSPIILMAVDTGGTWIGDGITDSDLGVFNPAIAGLGNHTISYTVCGETDEIIITVVTAPEVDVLSNTIACNGYILPELTNGSYYTGTNATGDSLSSGQEITTSQLLYIYVGTSACNSESEFSVEINETPEVDVLEDVISNTNYILPPLLLGNYYTEPNGEGLQLYPGDEINQSQTIYIYIELGEEPDTCSGQSSFYVRIFKFMPFFTPNGNGENDFWIISSEVKNGSDVYIYDRFGNLVATINPVIEGWDGTNNGLHLPSSEYWFIAQLPDNNVFRGNFSLIRK